MDIFVTLNAEKQFVDAYESENAAKAGRAKAQAKWLKKTGSKMKPFSVRRVTVKEDLDENAAFGRN